MDENNQDRTGSKLRLWLPPLSPKDQDKLKSFQKKRLIVRIGFARKTLWDWLPLLIQLLGALAIPVAIALGTAWFSYQQNQTDIQLNNKQHQIDQQLALDQQRETVLKTYLDDMADLLLNHNLSKSKPGDIVSEVARERTLTTLRRLNADRNRIVLQFLQDAHLIGPTNKMIIDLSHADLNTDDLSGSNFIGVNLSYDNLSHATLSRAILSNTDLSDINLSHANLSAANLYDATLSHATLSYAYLNQTDLSDANLSDANFSHADLSDAILSHAYLSNADLYQATLSHANLYHAYFKDADLYRANLSDADLSSSDLSDAYLFQANFYHAYLSDADFYQTLLNDADLRGAYDLIQQQLDQVFTCKGALLPKGLICHYNQ